jgi:three-Cys-motif partner protein
LRGAVNRFHETKKSAAVLKHGIIDSYAPPFIGKTGKWSTDHRVAFIDGYAGPGRYEDHEEGSGAMLLRHAREHASMPRRVELHFVENDEDTVAKLREVISAEGYGIDVTVTDGDISEVLPGLLEECENVPLFVYLDPCGLVIPLEEVTQIFDRPGGQGAPATEVLINFSAVTLRRIAGHLTSQKPVEATLVRMDKVCGGDWWRRAWLEALPDATAAEEAVVGGYADRLRESAGRGGGTWVIDVRPRVELKPLYYLVFATRHAAGFEYFGESASLGLQAWRRYSAASDAEGTLFGESDTWEQAWKAQEAKLKQLWVDVLAERLSDQLAKGEAFRVLDRYGEIFGDLAGVARGLHLSAAMTKVHASGLTSTNPVGVTKLLELRLEPA